MKYVLKSVPTEVCQGICVERSVSKDVYLKKHVIKVTECVRCLIESLLRPLNTATRA